jgi:hypothetical protein
MILTGYFPMRNRLSIHNKCYLRSGTFLCNLQHRPLSARQDRIYFQVVSLFMQKFVYRIPRYLVDLPVSFTVQGSAIAGRCKEISKEGMKVQLQQQVTTGTCGTVQLSYQELSLELAVCVAHAETGGLKGLKFLFESEKDRAAVERLVALLAGSSGHHGPVLVQ